jgi:GlpG protein
LSLEPNANSWDTLSRFGYLPPNDIWDGKYWGLVSSAFVHLQIWHVAFNVYWLWILGGALELAVGRIRWLIFFLAASIVSSGIQFGLSGSTGIGASGVLYGMFGLMWVSRSRYEAFQKILSKQTIVVFLVWLGLCVVATLAKVMNIGNGAHIGGLLFGAAVAAVFLVTYRVRASLTGMAALVLAAVVPLFWCPWSPIWTGKQGYNAHVKRDYQQAVRWYQRSLELGGDPVWTLRNMTIAFAAMGNRNKYNETLERLRQVDENAAREIEDSTKGKGT